MWHANSRSAVIQPATQPILGIRRFMMTTSLDIIYQDEYLCAVNKPHGLLVHRSRIAADASEFAIQILRDQLGVRVYPGHRIDRKTGGVLIFGLVKEMDSALQKMFMDQHVAKTYLALVRGYTDDEGRIDYPLRKENGTLQEAFTNYRTVSRAEIDVPSDPHPTSRYSLVEVTPETGRMHQIRKHMKHIFHPIIGDRPHGCNKQNRMFVEKFDMHTMLLHAQKLSFNHPVTNENITIEAPLQPDFVRMKEMMGL